jgi:AcrR family transcriptional regulator
VARGRKEPQGGSNGTRVRDPDGTRKALMTSATKLFEQHGYAATSVQTIVDTAGLTKGAFYYHFGTKEELLANIHDEFIDYQLDRALQVLARDVTPGEQLRALVVEALFEPMALYHSEITVFVQERRYLTGELFEKIKAKRDEFESCFIRVIERGTTTGVFRPLGPPRLIAFGLIGINAWAHTWLDIEGAVPLRGIGELYADLVIDGLAVR